MYGEGFGIKGAICVEQRDKTMENHMEAGLIQGT